MMRFQYVAWALIAQTALSGCGEDKSVKEMPTGPLMDAGGSDGASAQATDSAAAGTPLPCDVRKVLETHCWQCHGDTPKFGAPLSLTSVEALNGPSTLEPTTRLHEQLMKRVHSTDPGVRMPPPPNDALSDADLSVLHAWITGGLKADNGSCSSSPTDGGADGGHANHDPIDSGIDPIDPSECDDTVRFLAHDKSQPADSTPYQVPLAKTQYTCFTFKAPWTDARHGLQFSPIIDDERVVHHWILYASDKATGNDGEVESCSGAHPGAAFVAGWAPGGGVQTMPDGVGVKLATGANARYILEIHYSNGAGHKAADRSGVEVCATKKLRPNTAATHWLGSESINLPGGIGTAQSTCDPNNAGPVTLLSLWPHMHTTGRHMKFELLRENGDVEVLHDKDFAFEYQTRSPLSTMVSPGDRLRTTCTFDNDTGSTVTYGPATDDEMCYAFVLAYPEGGLSGKAGIAASVNACLN